MNDDGVARFLHMYRKRVVLCCDIFNVHHPPHTTRVIEHCLASGLDSLMDYYRELCTARVAMRSIDADGLFEPPTLLDKPRGECCVTYWQLDAGRDLSPDDTPYLNQLVPLKPVYPGKWRLHRYAEVCVSHLLRGFRCYRMRVVSVSSMWTKVHTPIACALNELIEVSSDEENEDKESRSEACQRRELDCEDCASSNYDRTSH